MTALRAVGVADRHVESAAVELRDGGSVVVRPIAATDGPALAEFHEALSDQSRYRRFLSPHPHLSAAEVRWFTEMDQPGRVAFVAEADGDLVAIGRYDREGDTAEVAFTVADAHQDRGLGTVLLMVLARHAFVRGVTSFFADVLCENRQMLHVFRDAGFDLSTEVSAGVIHLSFFLPSTTSVNRSDPGRGRRPSARVDPAG